MITIKFITNSIAENNQHQIPKSLLRKYPNSIFNFCQDFDQDTIEFDTETISYDEFIIVADIIHGRKHYWDISNPKIRTFLEKYGLIDSNFEIFEKSQRKNIDKELLRLHNFIYGHEKIYCPQTIEIYDDIKNTLSNNEHIVSVQFTDNFINIYESIPIYSKKTRRETTTLKCTNNEIDINQARNLYCKNFCVNKIPENLYSDNNDKYMETCIYLNSEMFLFYSKEAEISHLYKITVNDNTINYIDKPVYTSKIFKWSADILALYKNDINCLIENIILRIRRQFSITNCKKTFIIRREKELDKKLDKKLDKNPDTEEDLSICSEDEEFYTINQCFINLKNIELLSPILRRHLPPPIRKKI